MCYRDPTAKMSWCGGGGVVGEKTEAEKLRRMEERIEEVVLTSIIIIINTIITIISFFMIIPRLPHSVFSFKATNLDLMEELMQRGRKSSRHDHHHLFFSSLKLPSWSL